MKTIDNARHHVDGSAIEYIGSGARNTVVRTKVGIVSGDKRRLIEMAVRLPKSALSARKFYDEAKRWAELRAAGIPVAHQTYRLSENSAYVCCTDLTQGGRNYVFSHTNQTVDDQEWEIRLSKGEIINSVPNGAEAIQKLRSIAVDLATLDLEIMNPDAFYFIIEKDTLAITPCIGDYKHIIDRQLEDPALLLNNLRVAHESVRSRHEIFGVSREQLDEFFGLQERPRGHSGHISTPDKLLIV